MTHDELLSSIRELKTSDFVYSSLSFYGSRRGGELPGLWFVRALGALGLEETAVRQTLFRMERNGSLESRASGRSKLYRASATTQAVMDVGADRMLAPAEEEAWDGRWTLVRFVLENESRKARDRIRDILTVEGFSPLGSGLYVHPRSAATRAIEAAGGLDLERDLHVFRGARLAGPDDRAFADQLWDLPKTAARYRGFIDRFAPLSGNVDSLGTREAFGLRFAMVFEFLRITWDDPDLPSELLPADWPGPEARKLAATLYETLLERAVAYADEIMSGLPASVRSVELAGNPS